MNYYHYTSRSKLDSILQARAILPDLHAHDPAVHGKHPLVWVSSMSPWDPICRATLELDPEGWFCLLPGKVPGVPYGAARIHVAGTVTKEWDALLASNGADSAAIFKLAQTGYDSGSDPERWRACPGPVSACFWLDVELWSGTQWEPLKARGDFYRIGDLDAFISHHPVIEGGLT
jgi:hypothetical protein